MKYSKHPKYNILPTIKIKNSSIKQLLHKESVLTEQVQQLDQIINTDNLHFINNYIFTSDVKNRLSTDILQCINKQHRLLAYGFELLKGDYEHYIIKRDLVPNTQTFKQKLHDISVRSVEKYQFEKHKQLQKIYQSRWKVISTREQTRIKNKQTNQTSNPHLQGTYNYLTAKKILTQVPDSTHNITEEDVSKLLKKFKNVITIWLPPKTYPQFYSIIIPSVSITNLKPRCRIKRYIFFKQGLNEQFFAAILQYVKIYFGMNIQSLQMIMSKANYISYFKNCGWSMKSWEGVDKIYAIYSKQI